MRPGPDRSDGTLRNHSASHLALQTLPRRAVLAFSSASWARPWRRQARGDGCGRARGNAAGPSTAHGPRIAVIGNCQATGVAQSLRLLVPEARVDTIPIQRLARDFGGIDRLARSCARYDHVFSHFFPERFLPGGSALTLAARLPRVRLFPTIVFPGFHPDQVLVGDVDHLSPSTLMPSPTGPYHSAIALCAYLEGLDVAGTLTLYDDATFAALGYYRLWDEGSALLLRSARELGFDLSHEVTRWARRGCFMHVINHPTLPVLADLARRLAREAGCPVRDIAVEAYQPDDLLAESVWPVLPPIAARYGLAAGTLFKGRRAAHGRGAVLDLRGFVEASFALYGRQSRSAFACGRIAAWRADPVIRGLFAAR